LPVRGHRLARPLVVAEPHPDQVDHGVLHGHLDPLALARGVALQEGHPGTVFEIAELTLTRRRNFD
jgi:hypothetical protein